MQTWLTVARTLLELCSSKHTNRPVSMCLEGRPTTGEDETLGADHAGDAAGNDVPGTGGVEGIVCGEGEDRDEE